MEKQMVEILLDLQKDFKEFRSELKKTILDVKNISTDLKETQSDVRDIKETVNRMEASQTENIIALLKGTKQKSISGCSILKIGLNVNRHRTIRK
ncbi:MAG: hypothetical protein ACQEWI_09490 [Bacillota bacterium]